LKKAKPKLATAMEPPEGSKLSGAQRPLSLVHGNNLRKKIHGSKYSDRKSADLLAKINPMYESWTSANLKLKGPVTPATPLSEADKAIISKRVKLLNPYKDFIDSQEIAEHFDSRSNLQSSVLEEFLYYLFKDFVGTVSQEAIVGKAHSFKDLFFRPKSFKAMMSDPGLILELKDHDFTIGISAEVSVSPKGSTTPQVSSWELPAVAIECKTYLDKTMLQDAATAAQALKSKNPNALYIVVAERLKLSEKVNLKRTQIDQIFILRKQINVDRENQYDARYIRNPIYDDVVTDLFALVAGHLSADWDSSIASALASGKLL
jgi:hypothetical protein